MSSDEMKNDAAQPASRGSRPSGCRVASNAKTTDASSARDAPAKSAPVVARGDYQVQLGAFSAPAKARAQKAELEKSYRGLVGALTIQAPSGAAKLYRVRSSAMSEAAARSAGA